MSSEPIQPVAPPEERFRAAFDQTIVGVVHTDLQGRVLLANDAFCQMVGMASADVLGRDSRHYTHPDDRTLNVENIRRIAGVGASSIVYEKRYVRGTDGAIVHAQVSISPVRDESAQTVSLIAIVEDITDRRRAEQATRAAADRFRFLSQLAEATHNLADPEQVMAEATRRLGEQLGVSRCAYADVEPDGDAFAIRHDYTVPGLASTVGHYALSAFGTRAASDMRAGRTLVVRDVDAELGDDPIGAATFNAIGIKAIVCCPLNRGCGSRLQAMMAVHHATPRDWTPDEVSLIEATVDRCWSYVERARVARDLMASEARLNDMLRTALDCIVCMDHAGRVTEWNPAAVETFGYARDEAIGREMAELIIPPAYRERHRTGLARFLATGEGHVLGRRLELSAVRRDGTEFPVELTITPVTLSDPPEFTGYIRDITARRQAEREREGLLKAEQAARAEAEHASRTKDEFLATLSHELRTPLSAILGWSQLLRRSDGNRTMLAEGLETIERNARVQSQIIDDLLDMSRIISGKIALEVRRIDLQAVVRAGIETVRPAAAAKGILLKLADDDDRDSHDAAMPILADPNRLQQVFWNLLSNAIKFTPAGGRVEVRSSRGSDGSWHVTITDDGEGIAPQFLPFVFDRFRQADASTTRKHGGLGLGLAIVRQLAEVHGGTVWAESDGPGRGARFTVALPIAAADPAVEPTSAPLQAKPVDLPLTPLVGDGDPVSAWDADLLAKLSGRTAYVVDDEPDARDLLKRLLEGCGMSVRTAADANAAIELFTTSGRPDVLVSDIGMPGEDGYTLLGRVRALPRAQGGDVPAIALTAYARADDRVRAVRAGFRMHVPKPIEPAELLTMLASLLEGPP